MYLPHYTPKHAMSDLGKVIAYRVRQPTQSAPPELDTAVENLMLLSTGELLEVMVSTLSSGFVQGAPRPSKDPAKGPLQCLVNAALRSNPR